MDSFSVQLNHLLDEYSREFADAVEEAEQEVAKESAKTLKATSPKRPGHGEYARSWGVKVLKGTEAIPTLVVHNKKHYQLTHLLENGHRIVNKKGEWGRTNGIKHIKPVEQWANEEFVRKVKAKL